MQSNICKREDRVNIEQKELIRIEIGMWEIRSENLMLKNKMFKKEKIDSQLKKLSIKLKLSANKARKKE